MLHRPTLQPFTKTLLLLFFVALSVVLAIATGFYHQSWRNQLKKTVRVQNQLKTLQLDQSTTNQ
jgi:uncharacterized membrane protein